MGGGSSSEPIRVCLPESALPLREGSREVPALQIGGNRWLPTQEPRGSVNLPNISLKVLLSRPPPPLLLFAVLYPETSKATGELQIGYLGGKESPAVVEVPQRLGAVLPKGRRGLLGGGRRGAGQMTTLILPSARSAPTLVLTVHPQAAGKRSVQAPWCSVCLCVLRCIVWAAVVSCL